MMSFSENTSIPPSMIRRRISRAEITKRLVMSYGGLLKRVPAVHAVACAQLAGQGSNGPGELDVRFAHEML